MSIIKIFLTIVALLLLLFFESFFLKVFSFSIFIILTISIWKRVDNLFFYSSVTIFGIILDTVLHIPLGVHTTVIFLLLMVTDIFWFFVHRDSISGYIGVFLFTSLYYLLIPNVTSLLEEGVLSEISLGRVTGIIISSIISAILCIVIDRFVKSVRSERNSGVIRLK